MFNIKEELKKLPHTPGVYIMHEGDLILYIGKAVDLHNRVRQYFQGPKGKSPKILRMVQRIEYFEYIITDTEMEALILENNLIKEHRPPYNTMLKDDKQYPYIKVTTQEMYPRIFKTRNLLRDKNRYFGPYTNVLAVNQTLDLMKKIWPLRDCRRNLPRDIGKERPCLNYYIGRCCGPCTGSVNAKDYGAMVEQAIDLINGRHTAIVQDLEQKMKAASDALDFEKAAQYRDQINSIHFLSQQQKLEHAGSEEDRDVIAIAKEEDSALVQVFFIRNGKLIGREHFMMEGTSYLKPGTIIGVFIQQFYSAAAFIPRELLVEEMPPEAALLSQYLSARREQTAQRSQRVQILQPQRGEKAKLVHLAHQNAALTLSQFGARLKAETKRTRGAVQQLEALLDFNEYPIERIEAYDISNTFGSQSVGSMVVFEGGKPKNSDYRKFKIQSVQGADDYASMEEVLRRRFTHALTEIRQLAQEGKDPSLGRFTKLPDLILMDGGRGQVNSALKVLSEVGLDIPVAGMVKDDYHRTRGLYYENREIDFGKNRDAFHLITRIQDEAHRFAISYHRKLRSDQQVRSVLDQIPGIGSVRRKALLRQFGSVDTIKTLSVDELKKAEGMNLPAAEAVYTFFHTRKEDPDHGAPDHT